MNEEDSIGLFIIILCLAIAFSMICFVLNKDWSILPQHYTLLENVTTISSHYVNMTTP